MKKILVLIILLFSLPLLVNAAGTCTGSSITCSIATNKEECIDGGACTWTDGPAALSNPLPTGSPSVLIGNVINAVLGIVGSLALAMFIYGGLTWMLAAGNEQRVQKGKDILLWATLGLVVIFSSYALVRFVFVGLGFPQ